MSDDARPKSLREEVEEYKRRQRELAESAASPESGDGDFEGADDSDGEFDQKELDRLEAEVNEGLSLIHI